MEKRTIIKTTLLSGFSVLALCFDMHAPNLSDVQKSNGFAEVAWNISKSISDRSMLASFLFIAMIAFSLFVEKNREHVHERATLIVNLMIAAVWLMAEGFRIDNTLNTLYISCGQVLKSVIYYVGIVYVLNRIALFLLYFLNNKASQEKQDGEEEVLPFLRNFFKEHTFWFVFLLLAILWFPHLLVSYPANFCYDAYNQMAQYLDMRAFTSHHPPVSTLILGTVFRLGANVSGNFGLFLYVLIQMVLLAVVEAYMVCLMCKLHARPWLVRGTLLICVFVPYYSAYSTVVLKDNIYTYFFLLFIIELVFMICRKEKYFNSIHSLLWVIANAGVILLRNNGKYVIYPVTCLLLLTVIRNCYRDRKINKNSVRRYAREIVIVLTPIIAAALLSAGITRQYHIEKGSIREALSLPFQQTARYVLYYEDEITEEERTDINAVLDCSSIAEKYDPRISDPVKGTFKETSTKGDLIRYIQVWVKQFFRHPMTYLEATANQNYYIVYPFIPNDQVYIGLETSYQGQEELWEAMGVHSVESLTAAKEKLRAYYNLCFQLPVLNLLSHPSTYTLVLIWLSIFSIVKRKEGWLLAAFPLLLSLLIILLSPVIQGHARYAFPIIYSMPLMIAFYLYNGEEEELF